MQRSSLRVFAGAFVQCGEAVEADGHGASWMSSPSSLNNLAIVLQELRAFAEAKLLLERALEIQEKALGPEHPGVAGSLNNLAILCSVDQFCRPRATRSAA